MQSKLEDQDWVTGFLADNLVWDAHAGVFPAPDADLANVPDWAASGVDYVSLNIGFDVMGWQDCVATLAAYRRMLGDMHDQISVVGTIDEIDTAHSQSRLAVSFDIEGVNALNGDIGMLSVYHDLGVRQMLLAYNLGNKAAGGCHDDEVGLTGFGREVVREMNRLGMIVDCSHAARKTTFEMMECSTQPVVFTHSNPTQLWQHQRNIDDDQIRACAETGGVIGINGMGIFLGENDVSAKTFADHVCYVADLTGPNHVGFGLDWKPPQKSAPDLGAILQSRPDYWPKGQQYDTKGIKLFAPSGLAELLIVLKQRGWSEPDLQGFTGNNFHEIAQKVWQE